MRTELKLVIFILFLSGVECKRKEIIVIGGGIAGLAAARTIRNNKTADYHVTVYEARRDRYGGRVWTDKKNMPDAKGIEADLGGAVLNTESADNPLLNLTKRLELSTTELSQIQLYIPELDKRIIGKELAEYFVETRKLFQFAIDKAKDMPTDQSVHRMVTELVKAFRGQDKAEDVITAAILEMFTTYNIPDFSAKLYQADMLDFGYTTYLHDGMGELTDRLVSGGDGEFPLWVELRKVVRQLKVDTSTDQVVVRLKDGTQTRADAVIVAVPASVLRKEELMFEPPLPAPYVKALKQIGVSFSNKIVVEFAEVFWSRDTGVFLIAGDGKSDPGVLQTWLNMHKVVGRPVLVSFIKGQADRFEAMKEEKLIKLIRKQLAMLFGKAAKTTEIVKLLRSDWKTSAHSGFSSSYPRVGNDIKIWDTLSAPLCPNIYFAGEHTTYKGIGSLHGAYNSGVRAAEQFMSGLCEERAREEEKKRQEEEKKIEDKEEDDKKKGKKGKKGKKDEKKGKMDKKVKEEKEKEKEKKVKEEETIKATAEKIKKENKKEKENKKKQKTKDSFKVHDEF